MVDAFLAAARAGDFEALLEVLDPNVVQRIHTASGDRRWAPTMVGAEKVAKRALSAGGRFAPYGRPAIINGNMGAVVVIDGKRRAVNAMTITNGKITTMDVFVDPPRRDRPGRSATQRIEEPAVTPRLSPTLALEKGRARERISHAGSLGTQYSRDRDSGRLGVPDASA